MSDSTIFSFCYAAPQVAKRYEVIVLCVLIIKTKHCRGQIFTRILKVFFD